MTLHPYIGLSELIEYCQFCHEYKGKIKRVMVHKHVLSRIRKVVMITDEKTEFLGIKFLAK